MIKTEITGGSLAGDYSHSGALVNSRLLGPSRPPTSTPGAISPSHLNGHREGMSDFECLGHFQADILHH